MDVPPTHPYLSIAPAAVAELAPQGQKKRRGALHKLGKMLGGGKKGATPLQQPLEGQPRPRPNPAALTAPLEHSMRQQEAAAMQAQLLSEQQGQAVAVPHDQQQPARHRYQQQAAAEPEPVAVPAAIRQHLQQQRQGEQRQQRRQTHFTAAEEAEEQLVSWPEHPAWPPQQQQQQQQLTRQSPFESPVRGALQELPVPQQLVPRQRPASGLSDCPPEGGRYLYPDAAAAGYAAGLAALQAEGFGTPGLPVAGAAGGREESWPDRRLHVMHSNLLFDEAGGRGAF